MRTSLSRLLALSSVALLALNVSACKDDPVDFCDDNPDAEECQPDFCEENPDAEECFCEENPDDPACQTSNDACDADALAAVIREQLNIQTDTVDEFPEVDVESVSEIDGENVSNYRVLTFTLPSSGQPGTDVPDVSKLYLDFDTNAFLDLNDEDALTNTEWDIAFDGKMLNYVYANSGHSGGYTGNWPAGLMIAELDGAETQADFAAIDATDTDAIPFGLEQWIDADTCEPQLTDWLPMLQTKKVLPQTVVGSWYTYEMDQNHAMVPNPVGYAVYNSADAHHVYKFKFVSYDSRSLEVKIAVQDQFQQNACSKEINAVADATAASDVAQSNLPDIDVETIDDATRDDVDEDDNPITVDVDYRVLRFTLPEATAGASKLYLNVQENTFVDMTDEDALGVNEDDEGTPIRNEDWDLAIDLETGVTYIRSGQSGGYPHADKYVGGWNPRGMMAARMDGISDEDAFIAWDSGADTSIFAFEDYIDHQSKECTLDADENGAPNTIAGADFFDASNDSAIGIYAGGPCHNVFQLKVLSYDESTGDVELGVINANPGMC